LGGPADTQCKGKRRSQGGVLADADVAVDPQKTKLTAVTDKIVNPRKRVGKAGSRKEEGSNIKKENPRVRTSKFPISGRGSRPKHGELEEEAAKNGEIKGKNNSLGWYGLARRSTFFKAAFGGGGVRKIKTFWKGTREKRGSDETAKKGRRNR